MFRDAAINAERAVKGCLDALEQPLEGKQIDR